MNYVNKDKSALVNMGYCVMSDDDRTTPRGRIREVGCRALGRKMLEGLVLIADALEQPWLP